MRKNGAQHRKQQHVSFAAEHPAGTDYRRYPYGAVPFLPGSGPEYEETKGFGHFLCRGLISTFLCCTQKDSALDETVFLEIIAEYAIKIPLQHPIQWILNSLLLSHS